MPASSHSPEIVKIIDYILKYYVYSRHKLYSHFFDFDLEIQ